MAGKKGFQHLTSDQRKVISSKGGKAAHKAGKAHTYTPEEARLAGSKGGKSAQAKKAASKKLVGAAAQGITEGAKAPAQSDNGAQAIQEGDSLSQSAMGSDSMGCGSHGGCGGAE